MYIDVHTGVTGVVAAPVVAAAAASSSVPTDAGVPVDAGTLAAAEGDVGDPCIMACVG